MNFYSWLANRFSNRGKALSHYKRGMVRARKHDRRGAIDDYSVAIGMPEAPANVRAMALYNRALVLVAMGDEQQGLADLNAVLEMHESPENVRSSARQKLAKLAARSREGNMS